MPVWLLAWLIACFGGVGVGLDWSGLAGCVFIGLLVGSPIRWFLCWFLGRPCVGSFVRLFVSGLLRRLVRSPVCWFVRRAARLGC